MRRWLALAVALLVGTTGWAQLKIISLKPDGELVWSNYVYRAFYDVESAPLPGGPWTAIATVADLEVASTNLLTAQVLATNAQAFYRVRWLMPDPVGVWDYQAFDSKGTLVVTGLLNITSMKLEPPATKYALSGWRDLRYVGPVTNALWWLGGQPGTGYFSGSLESSTIDWSIWWPTNCVDCQVGLRGPIGPDRVHNGSWGYWTWSGWQGGAMTATRVAETNSGSASRRPAQ